MCVCVCVHKLEIKCVCALEPHSQCHNDYRYLFSNKEPQG